MTILTARVEQARITITAEFRPCPFCGSSDLIVVETLADTFHGDFIDCRDCAATAPAEVWNRATRPGPPPRKPPYIKRPAA